MCWTRLNKPEWYKTKQDSSQFHFSWKFPLHCLKKEYQKSFGHCAIGFLKLKWPCVLLFRVGRINWIINWYVFLLFNVLLLLSCMDNNKKSRRLTVLGSGTTHAIWSFSNQEFIFSQFLDAISAVCTRWHLSVHFTALLVGRAMSAAP